MKFTIWTGCFALLLICSYVDGRLYNDFLNYGTVWDVDGLDTEAVRGVYGCKSQRAKPSLRFAREPISFRDEECDRHGFSMSQRLQRCPSDALQCHQSVDLSSAIIGNETITFSLLVNYSCEGEQGMRVFTLMNNTVDIKCGEGNDSGTLLNGLHVINMPKGVRGWMHIILQITPNRKSAGAEPMVAIMVTELPKEEDRPQNIFHFEGNKPSEKLELGYIQHEDLPGNDLRSINGEILVADLYMTKLNDSDLKKESLFVSQIMQNITNSQCICEDQMLPEDPDSMECTDGSERFADVHVDDPAGLNVLSDGIWSSLMKYGRLSLLQSEMNLVLQLDDPALISRVTIYAWQINVIVSKFVEGGKKRLHVFCTDGSYCQGTRTHWTRTKDPKTMKTRWDHDNDELLIVSKLRVKVFRIEVEAFLHEIILLGRYIKNRPKRGECFCFPGNSKGDLCGECDQCECRNGYLENTTKDCRPFLTHLVPTYGPVYGGTIITIYGGLLSPFPKSNRPTVTIGNGDPCIITHRNDSVVFCKTPRGHAARYQTLTMKILVGDAIYDVEPKLKFAYRPNPTLHRIERSDAKGFKGRDTNVTLRGEHLDSASDPKLEIELRLRDVAIDIIPGRCFRFDATKLICEIIGTNVTFDASASLRLIFDGYVIKVPSSPAFQFYSIPLFDSAATIHYNEANDMPIKIKKVEEEMCCSKGEYSVTLNGKICHITEVDERSIYCVPPKLSLVGPYPISVPIKVTLHGLSFSAGHVNWIGVNRGDENGTKPFVSGIIGAVITLLLMTCVFIGIMVYIKRISTSTPNVEMTMHLREAEERPHCDSEHDSNTEPCILNHLDRNLRHLIEDLLLTPSDFQIQEMIGRDHAGAPMEELAKFIEEATVMKDFDHPNVLSLIGVIADKHQVYVIVPFMENGDLRSHISSQIINSSKYMRYALDVARGMEYLSKQKFIHRDLAARNCMVDADEKVLIGDFGLARDIYHADYYQSEDRQKPLPYKWMAIESLERKVFSSQSDVWAFGILLWEIFSQGAKPYQDVANPDLKDYIKGGHRLPAPIGCPYYIAGLMKDCWNEKPFERPTFTDIVSELEKFISLEFERSRYDDSIESSLRSKSTNAEDQSQRLRVPIPDMENTEVHKRALCYKCPPQHSCGEADQNDRHLKVKQVLTKPLRFAVRHPQVSIAAKVEKQNEGENPTVEDMCYSSNPETNVYVAESIKPLAATIPFASKVFQQGEGLIDLKDQVQSLSTSQKMTKMTITRKKKENQGLEVEDYLQPV